MHEDEYPRVRPQEGDEVTLEHRRRARAVAQAWAAGQSLEGLSRDDVNALANSGDELSEALDAIAVDRGRALFARGSNFSGEQLVVLRGYLSQLAYIASRAIDEVLRQQSVGLRKVPAPPALPYGVDRRGAEMLVRDWMLHLGIVDAVVTSYSKDGGIDVASGEYVAQVKHQGGNVGRPEVQGLAGAAFGQKKEPLFFTSAYYTAEAIAWADSYEIRMPLFVFNAEAGTLNAASARGRQFLQERE